MTHKNQKIKYADLLKEFFIFLLVLIPCIFISGTLTAYAQSLLPIPEGLCGDGFPCAQGDTAKEQTQYLVGRVVDNVRYVIGAVAILMIIVAGVKLVLAEGEEETFKKQYTTIFYAIVGLFFIALAGDLADIFEVDRGGFLKDPNVMIQKSKLFNRTVEIVITFIKYIIGSVAVIFIVRNGLRLVLLGGNEEDVTKDKKNIFYALLGLILVLIANPIINKALFKIDTSSYPGLEPVRPGVDPKQLAREIAGMTNLVAAITGPFALLSLIAGGLMYTLAGGDDEKLGKAKKIIMWSLIGIIIIYGAFAIVSTFVSRQFEGL